MMQDLEGNNFYEPSCITTIKPSCVALLYFLYNMKQLATIQTKSLTTNKANFKIY